MAKERIKETISYIKEKAQTGSLNNIKLRDVESFNALLNMNVKNNNGAALSLNWSWHNTRPSKDMRHAIRAHLLTSICAGDIEMTATAAEATRVKNKTANWLHNEITSLSYVIKYSFYSHK